MAQFHLQPAESELQQLADQRLQKAGEHEHELETAAFEGGAAIRAGEHTLANLEAVVRWKSERVVHFLIGNSEAKIRQVLAVAASPESTTRKAVEALLELRGVDLAIASAILAAIDPSRYNVLDFRTLEALGHERHNVEFYNEYVTFCRGRALLWKRLHGYLLRFGRRAADNMCRLKLARHHHHQPKQKYEHKNTRMLGQRPERRGITH